MKFTQLTSYLCEQGLTPSSVCIFTSRGYLPVSELEQNFLEMAVDTLNLYTLGGEMIGWVDFDAKGYPIRYFDMQADIVRSLSEMRTAQAYARWAGWSLLMYVASTLLFFVLKQDYGHASWWWLATAIMSAIVGCYFVARGSHFQAVLLKNRSA